MGDEVNNINFKLLIPSKRQLAAMAANDSEIKVQFHNLPLKMSKDQLTVLKKEFELPTTTENISQDVTILDFCEFAAPPINIKFEKIACLILPKKIREPLLGDLIEEYHEDILPKYGSRYANTWLCLQILWASLSVAAGKLVDVLVASIFKQLAK